MLSAVSGSLKLQAIYVTARGLFSWSMERMVTMDSIRPWEKRSSVVRIYKTLHCNARASYGSRFRHDNLIFARVHLNGRKLKLF
jgi:hypothetical protein